MTTGEDQMTGDDPIAIATPGETGVEPTPRWRRGGTTVFLLAMLLISAVAWWQLLRPGLPFSYDGDLHVVRMLHLQRELEAGQFPVRWGSDQAWGYGYPTFNFYYPLPAYVTAALHLAGVPAAIAFKALLIGCLVAATVFSGLWGRAIWGWFGGLLVGSLYVLNPPLLQAVYLAMSVGAVLTMALLPLLLLLLYGMRHGSPLLGWRFLALSLAIAATTLSHNFFGPICVAVLAGYAVAISAARRSTEPIRFGLLCIVAGLGISAFFWAPAFLELRYTATQPEGIGFPVIADLFDFGLGPSQGLGDDGLPYALHRDTLGIAGIAAMALALSALIIPDATFARSQRAHIVFALAGFGGLIFLMIMPFRRELWLAVPVLSSAEAASRLLMPIGVFCAISAGAVTRLTWSRPLVAVFFLATIFVYGFAFARPAWLIRANDADFVTYAPVMYGTADWHRTVLPLWANLDTDAPTMDGHVEILDGQGQINSYERHSVWHRLNLEMSTDGTILVPVFYFPGWRGWIDGVETTLKPFSATGTVMLSVPTGAHQVELRFANTPIRTASNAVSVVALVAVIGGTIYGSRTAILRRR